jgi:Rod binding domain-containing protein
MDSYNLVLTEPVLPPTPLQLDAQYQKLDMNRASNEQIAKDFESVLLYKVLDEMKNTIGDWGFEKDEISKQVQGIFWLNLADEIANNGGLGLWKDIYNFINSDEYKNNTIESLNENI